MISSDTLRSLVVEGMGTVDHFGVLISEEFLEDGGTQDISHSVSGLLAILNISSQPVVGQDEAVHLVDAVGSTEVDNHHSEPSLKIRFKSFKFFGSIKPLLAPLRVSDC